MKLNEVKTLTIFVFIAIIIIIWVPYLRNAIVKNNDNQFLSMGIIGNNNIENYFANNDTEVVFRSVNHWNISITNYMNDLQYLNVKVKIISYGDTLPNSNLITPSSAATIYEVPLFVASGETAYRKFEWSIDTPSSIITQQNSVEVTSNIIINDTSHPILITLPLALQNTTSVNPIAYSRIVFELWSLDKNTNTFNFNIQTPAKNFCIWNDVFFKINLNNLS